MIIIVITSVMWCDVGNGNNQPVNWDLINVTDACVVYYLVSTTCSFQVDSSDDCSFECSRDISYAKDSKMRMLPYSFNEDQKHETIVPVPNMYIQFTFISCFVAMLEFSLRWCEISIMGGNLAYIKRFVIQHRCFSHSVLWLRASKLSPHMTAISRCIAWKHAIYSKTYIGLNGYLIGWNKFVISVHRQRNTSNLITCMSVWLYCPIVASCKFPYTVSIFPETLNCLL